MAGTANNVLLTFDDQPKINKVKFIIFKKVYLGLDILETILFSALGPYREGNPVPW